MGKDEGEMRLMKSSRKERRDEKIKKNKMQSMEQCMNVREARKFSKDSIIKWCWLK